MKESSEANVTHVLNNDVDMLLPEAFKLVGLVAQEESRRARSDHRCRCPTHIPGHELAEARAHVARGQVVIRHVITSVAHSETNIKSSLLQSSCSSIYATLVVLLLALKGLLFNFHFA